MHPWQCKTGGKCDEAAACKEYHHAKREREEKTHSSQGQKRQAISKDADDTVSSAVSMLAHLQSQSAGLLPDPERPLRLKAAELAATEVERATEAFSSAGCVDLHYDEELEGG